MLPSLRTLFGILFASSLAAGAFWFFHNNTAPSSTLSEPVELLDTEICWALRINDPISLNEKKTKHPILSEALKQAQWINLAIEHLNKDSVAIPFLVFKHHCSDKNPVLAIGAPLYSSNSQLLEFVEQGLKARAKKTDDGYVFDALGGLNMQFHSGCIFLSPEFDFEINSLMVQKIDSRLPAWSADADMNLYCSSSSLFLTSDPNYNLNHPFSGDVYFRNESVEVHSIAFPDSEKNTLFGRRQESNITLEQFIPQNCSSLFIDHYGSPEALRLARIAALNSNGNLAEWNRNQAQLENNLNLVLDEVTFEWSNGSAATFEWEPARGDQFLILTQSDSLAFGQAIIQLPGVELIEESNHFYLKWSNNELWANSMPFPYNLEVNCATLRDNAVVMCSNIESLKKYSRSLDRLKPEIQKEKYNQKIEIDTRQVSFSNNSWGAFLKSEIVSSNYPNAHLCLYHGEDKRNFIHLSAGAREQIESGPSIEWEIAVQNNISKSPIWIKNHNSSEYYALWQDDAQTIHALDAKGKEMWTISIDEPILGEIHQIDLYRNSKYQFIFATKSALHCYDRLGKKVDGYPYTFSSKASSNLGVFDYDRDKNYRFVIGLEDGTVLNVKDEGIETKGWKASKQTSSIAKVKHLRAGSKDYIFTLNADGKIQLLKRNGETRYETKASLPKSTADLEFLMKSSIEKSSVFVIDTAERVVQINFNDGQMGEMTGIGSATDLLLTDIDGDLVADLILVNGSTIEAYNSARKRIFKTTLESQITGKPKLYTLDDGLAIAVLLKEQKKIVFLHMDGSLIDEDGLYGTSLPVIIDADKDKHQEALLLDGKRNIVCYEF